MTAQDLISRYNYDAFVPEKFEPWLNFEESPPLGQQAPDFPLWPLEGGASSLGEVWSEHTYTVVEFGSFT
jgi:hypothetical protein